MIKARISYESPQKVVKYQEDSIEKSLTQSLLFYNLTFIYKLKLIWAILRSMGPRKGRHNVIRK